MGNSIINSASNYDIPDVINKGLAYAIILAGLLSVIFIVWGGFKFILSGGDESKIKGAVGTIRYAIIGLIITVLSVVIVGLAGEFLGLNVVQYLNFNSVIQNVQDIGNSLSGSRGGRSSLD